MDNILIAFLTSRTIEWLQSEDTSAIKFYRRWHQHLTVKLPVKPNSTYTSEMSFDACIYICKTYFSVLAHLRYISKTFPVRCQIDIY